MYLRFKIQITGQVLTPRKSSATQSASLALQPGIPVPRAVEQWPRDAWLLSCLGNVKMVMWEPKSHRITSSENPDPRI